MRAIICPGVLDETFRASDLFQKISGSSISAEKEIDYMQHVSMEKGRLHGDEVCILFCINLSIKYPYWISQISILNIYLNRLLFAVNQSYYLFYFRFVLVQNWENTSRVCEGHDIPVFSLSNSQAIPDSETESSTASEGGENGDGGAWL